MKRTIIILALTLIGTQAFSQSVSDALNFAINDYEGSARTVAMGNAFTALGGDLGAVNLNPASSAVARKSIVSITPGTFISINTASGTVLPDGSAPFNKTMRNNNVGISIPHIGASIDFTTGRQRGLKNWTFGLVWNRTQTFADATYAQGTNLSTSFTGSMASNASGIFQDATYDAYKSADMNYESGVPYDLVTAYKAGLISTLGNDNYIGVAENAFGDEIAIGKSGVEQYFGRRISGSKSDLVFNFGFNFSDIVFLGVNLGYNSLTYKNEEYFKEEAVDPSDVMIDYDDNGDGTIDRSYNFASAKRNYSYKADGSGIHTSFGIIVNPVAGLRLGASMRTPTFYTIEERINYGASVKLTPAQGSSISASNTQEKSPAETYKYSFNSPMVFDFGAAYTFGKFAIFSLDYEICNYAKMKFSSSSYDDFDGFGELNREISQRTGIAHQIRIGGEIRPLSWLSVRSGYNLTTSPEYDWDNEKSVKTHLAHNNLNSAAVGLGFNLSSGWFFDITCRTKWYKTEYIIPYQDYIFETDDSGNFITENGMKIIKNFTPEIKNSKQMVSLFFTIGLKW